MNDISERRALQPPFAGLLTKLNPGKVEWTAQRATLMRMMFASLAVLNATNMTSAFYKQSPVIGGMFAFATLFAIAAVIWGGRQFRGQMW